jgi:hypothetical protein
MRPRLLLAALLSFAVTLPTRAAEPTPVEAGKKIDLVICLDISGSMEGLIESAKIKLWTIVNDFAKVEPTPTLRVGLLSYGCDAYDRNIGWVRKDCDLTTDLDELYKTLNAFRTNGGTEYAARVARDALRDLDWSKDKDVLKVIFVCGNEPADQDKEVHLKDVAEMARKQGVFINTIYCGPANSSEAQGWKDYAAMAGGKYSNIDQNRAKNEVVINTPFDKELLALGGDLNKTYFCYGRDGKDKQANQLVQDANAAKANLGAALERGVTKANAFYRCDAWDLVDRCKNDPKFDIKTLKDDELPEELRKLKPAERETFIKKKTEERAEVQKKINELNDKRSRFIAEEQKKQPKSEADKAFDSAVRGIVREQAATRGIKIPE